jgi:hypothetical protein
MHSTPNPKQTDPRDFLLIAPEDKELSNLAHDAMRYSSAQTRMGSDFSAGSPIPPVDLRFRPAAVNNVEVPSDRPSVGRRAVRAFIRFLWVACLGGAGVAWQFYGDAAKQIIAKSAPPFALILSPPLENPKLPEQPTPPAVQASATKAAPPQPARLAQTATEGVAPTAAALSPELAQLLQKMERDLATVGQGIEQLKTNQEQMARDNAKAAEQLKASQEQMARVIAKISEAKTSETKTSETKASEAKASEQNLRPRISAPPPRPTVTPTRKPVHTLPSPQARSQPQAGSRPQATMRRQAEPQSSSAPQPPTSER